MEMYLSLQVRKIATVFRLLYLAEEFDNIVIFRHEQSGRFNKQQIDSRCSYEVHIARNLNSAAVTALFP